MVGKAGCDVPIYSYGVMLGISFIVGWYVATNLAERDNLPPDRVARVLGIGAVWSIIGARILYFVANPDRLQSPLTFFRVWEGGLVAYGGFIGGVTACAVASRMHGISMLQLADASVPALGIGLFFTRIGCFLYGCDYGRTAEVAWAVQFPQDAPVWKHQLHAGLIGSAAERSLPVHPTQLYESLFGLCLFGLAMLVRRYRRFSGQVFLIFFGVYGGVRAYFETLRDDEQRGGLAGLSTSQLIGLSSVALAVFGYIYFWKQYRKDPQSMRLWEKPWKDPATVVAVRSTSAARSGRKGGKRAK